MVAIAQDAYTSVRESLTTEKEINKFNEDNRYHMEVLDKLMRKTTR